MEASLPEVYASLMADDVESFPALRPHQRHAWHAFLVQLGAMAVHEAGLAEPPADSEEWRRIIRGLTCDDWPCDEPWQLVVDDITKPAFMQCRASSSEQAKNFRTELMAPDEIDTLDTAVNHALKSRSISSSELDCWTFALITGQTTDAHSLQNPAISRISGKGSRLAFSITPSTRFGRHARRDISALLTQWSEVGRGYKTTIDGITLLWTVPWDGKKTLSLNELHPLYIEISRRIRLFVHNGRLYVRKAAGNSARIGSRGKLKGRTGDPWIPVNVTREKILTLPKIEGFTYRQISNCLNTGDWDLPLLCRPTADELTSPKQMYLVVRGMAPGEGENKTGGYYERIIPISHRVKTAMLRRDSDSAEDLGRIAKERVNDVKKVRDALQDAIATFIAKGDDIYNKDKFSKKALNNLRNRKEITAWRKRLDEIVDARFFEGLQAEFEKNGKEEQQAARDRWLWNDKDGVVDHARRILSDAQNALKCPSVERYRAVVNSDSRFVRNINSRKSGFPQLDYRYSEESD